MVAGKEIERLELEMDSHMQTKVRGVSGYVGVGYSDVAG